VTFNSKVSLVANGCELVDGKTDIYLYDAMALCAGKVMMMTIATDTIVVCTISKLDTI